MNELKPWNIKYPLLHKSAVYLTHTSSIWKEKNQPYEKRERQRMELQSKAQISGLPTWIKRQSTAEELKPVMHTVYCAMFFFFWISQFAFLKYDIWWRFGQFEREEFIRLSDSQTGCRSLLVFFFPLWTSKIIRRGVIFFSIRHPACESLFFLTH